MSGDGKDSLMLAMTRPPVFAGIPLGAFQQRCAEPAALCRGRHGDDVDQEVVVFGLGDEEAA